MFYLLCTAGKESYYTKKGTTSDYNIHKHCKKTQYLTPSNISVKFLKKKSIKFQKLSWKEIEISSKKKCVIFLTGTVYMQ